MNEEMRERLSAYLDGALADAERKAVEAQLTSSEDLRRELEALRAVSGAVKGLPKAALPPGFMARLQVRRARAAAPRDWVFLPPGYRPLAFALSTAVVALVVWDKTRSPSEFPAPRVGWEGDKVSVKTAAEAPLSQLDLSGRLSDMGASGASAKIEAPAGLGRRADAPGKPIEIAEDGGAGSGQGDAFKARSEEERSAINERLYQGLEREKKRMGIAQIIEKEPDDRDGSVSSSPQDVVVLSATPEPQRLTGKARSIAAVSAMRGSRQSGHPAARIIILKSAEALQTAWAAAGLAGEPPAVNFPKQMALFLACPPGCGIVSVRTGKNSLRVFYKEAGFEDPSARVRAVTASTKPVVVQPEP